MQTKTIVLLAVVLTVARCGLIRKTQKVVSDSLTALFEGDGGTNNTGGAAFVPLFSRDDVYERDLVLGSVNQKHQMDDPTTDCDASGCIVSFAKEIDVPFNSGSVQVFDVAGDSGSTKLYLSMTYVRWIHDMESLYFQPYHRVYGILTNDDSNDGSFEACQAAKVQQTALDNTGTHVDFVDISKQILRYESQTDTLESLASKFQCGHWDASDLQVCQMRHIEPSAAEFLAFHTVSPQVSLNASICAYFENDLSGKRCITISSSPTDFPATLKLSDNLDIEIKAIHDYDSQLAGQSVVAHSKDNPSILDATHTAHVDWYYMENVPGFGSFTGAGLAQVQSRYLNYRLETSNNYSKIYASPSVRGVGIDWALEGCDDQQSLSRGTTLIGISTFGSLLSVAVTQALSDATDFVKVQAGVYVRLRRRGTPRVICVIIAIIVAAIVVAGVIVGALALSAQNNKCCMKMGGEKRDYMTELTKHGLPITEKFATFGPELATEMTLRNGMVQSPKLILNAFIKPTLNANLIGKNIKIDWGTSSGTLTDWTYDMAKVYLTGGGSYVTLTFVVEGASADLDMHFSDDNLLMAVSTDTVPYGTVSRTYGISVSDASGYSLELCVNSVCKKPEKSDFDDGPDGGQNNGDDAGDIGTHSTDSLWKLFKLNIGFAFFVVIFWIIFAVIIIYAIYRLGRYLLYYLIFVLSCCPTAQALDNYIIPEGVPTGDGLIMLGRVPVGTPVTFLYTAVCESMYTPYGQDLADISKLDTQNLWSFTEDALNFQFNKVGGSLASPTFNVAFQTWKPGQVSDYSPLWQCNEPLPQPFK